MSAPTLRGRIRLGAAAVAVLAAAAVLALLANDTLRARTAFESGEAAFVAAPGDAAWTDTAATFGGLGRGLLGLADDIRYRKALQLYATIAASTATFDNGASGSRARGAAETALADVERLDPDRRRAARAAVLLGALFFTEPSARAGGPSSTDRAIAEFTNAIHLDPANVAAKTDLELILRLLVAHGEREGANPGSFGPSSSKKGAGSGSPGRGY